MFGAMVIVFREVLEAGLIIGIVMASARAIPGVKSWIFAGILGGIIGSCIVAAFTNAINGMFEGFGAELFNAAVLGTAVLMLAWHILWLASHGHEMAANLRNASQQAANDSRARWALAFVVGLSVLREGSEVALFLFGIAMSGSVTAASMFTGSAAGLALGAIVSLLAFLGVARVPMRQFFTVTNLLIAFLAAGLAAQSVAYLQSAGAVTVLASTAWETSFILSDKSLLGMFLHTIIGYDDRPSWLQVLVYAVVIAAMLVMPKFSFKRPRPAAA